MQVFLVLRWNVPILDLGPRNAYEALDSPALPVGVSKHTIAYVRVLAYTLFTIHTRVAFSSRHSSYEASGNRKPYVSRF